MQGTPAEAPTRDGRVLRAVRARAAVVDRLISELTEGRMPSTKEIARLSGVTERTLFNLFGSKQALLLAAVTGYRERALRSLPGVPEAGDKEDRLRAFLLASAAFLDEYATVRWTVQCSGLSIPEMRRGVIQTALLARTRAALGTGEDFGSDRAKHAMRALVDPLIWRQLRVHQRLGAKRAADVLAHMMLGAVTAP